MKALSGRDLPILCRSVFEGTDVLQNPSANKPIGTGPFKFVSWERGQSVRLDRNEAYWKPGLPYLNRIVARFIPDAATRSGGHGGGRGTFRRVQRGQLRRPRPDAVQPRSSTSPPRATR